MLKYKFKKYLKSQERNFGTNFKSQKTFKLLKNLIAKCSEKKINFNSKKDLKSLKFSDIKKIDENVRLKYQKEFVKILKPEIKNITKGILNDSDLSDIRVGAQCKYKKVYKSAINNKLRYKKYYSLKDYNLPATNELLCFSTNPHQDLSNQGFRSSMSLIFYFQITGHFKETCLMQNAIFKRKSGLFDFNSNEHYPNIIKEKFSKKMRWYVPKSMVPGKIFIQDSLTPHTSSKISSIPRIALNLKVQPKSLDYIYKIFSIRKKFKNNRFYNFQVLENDLVALSNSINSFNYELSILYLIQKKFDKAYETFNKFAISKFSKEKINKIFAGALFRKTYENVNSQDVKNIFKKDIVYNKLSCADAIMQTFKK